jgi:hypothetical protein
MGLLFQSTIRVIVLSLALTMISSPLAFTQEASSENLIVMPNSANCAPPSEGPGSSPENAVETDIYDIIFDAEDALEFNTAREFDCKWVRLSGHFQWADYWHYRGRLTAELEFRTDPGDAKLWIENFADPNQRRWSISGAKIGVTGLIYDLCARARATQASHATQGITLINMGGPCHYGSLQGLMLANVHIEQRLSEPFRRLRGEANRANFGDLVRVPITFEAWADIHTTTLTWIDRLPEGEAALLTGASIRDETRRRHIADDDDWLSFLTDPNTSPLLGPNFDARSAPFAIFIFRDDVLDDQDRSPDLREDFFGCVCVVDNCEETWPLLVNDTQRMADDYICLRTRYRDDLWSIRP